VLLPPEAWLPNTLLYAVASPITQLESIFISHHTYPSKRQMTEQQSSKKCLKYKVFSMETHLHLIMCLLLRTQQGPTENYL
jgi:hypothetical protein